MFRPFSACSCQVYLYLVDLTQNMNDVFLVTSFPSQSLAEVADPREEQGWHSSSHGPVEIGQEKDSCLRPPCRYHVFGILQGHQQAPFLNLRVTVALR